MDLDSHPVGKIQRESGFQWFEMVMGLTHDPCCPTRDSILSTPNGVWGPSSDVWYPSINCRSIMLSITSRSFYFDTTLVTIL